MTPPTFLRQPCCGRRAFSQPLAALLFAVLAAVGSGATAEQPNILWITCEDTSPHLGCYGDAYAVTPNLDRLATQGIRYTNAFAYTGVCAPSRSTLISGVNALRLGSQHMRSTTRRPEEVRPFPAYLRDLGYYTSNNAKQDYNFATPSGVWDESGEAAHWRKRRPGQPFFAVFNLGVTHQSQIFCPEERYRRNTARLTPEQRRDPARFRPPPIHPDTPEFRAEWARHYENLTAMDYEAADLLAQLEADGLAESTIVFFFGDNGTGMPSVKMFAWGPSLHVPLIVRFGERWRHLSPRAPGEAEDRLVSFVDFAPTVLSLAGAPLPAHFQGGAFLGDRTGPAREHVFGGKDRQAEAADTIRTVRDARFQYLRNFRPELPYGQYVSYVWQHASTRSWERLHREGRLSGPPARFFAPGKPAEELYSVTDDPWQVKNLAIDPRYAGELARYRELLAAEMTAAGDLGLLPEAEMHRRATDAGLTPYAIATDPRLNPLGSLLAAADIANRRDPANLPALLELTADEDSAVRWWGALGLVALGKEALPARARLETLTRDASWDVRIAAAEALAVIGEPDRALPILEAALREDSGFVRLAALQTASRLGVAARPLIPLIAAAARPDPVHKDVADYVARAAGYLPGRLEGRDAPSLSR